MTHHKLLPHESVAAIADIERLWMTRRSARIVLEQMRLWWPWRDLEPFTPLCQVCRLPLDVGTECSDTCRTLAGWFTIDFATYSTARALEPLLRVYKDASEPPPWMAEFFQDLVDECSGSALTGSVLIPVPHNRVRTWQPNATIWLRWTSRLSTRFVPPPRSGRPARESLDPNRYDVSALPPSTTVTLLDDLWTSGATLGSLAQAVRSAGATRVTAITIGRQLRPDRPASMRAYRTLAGRN